MIAFLLIAFVSLIIMVALSLIDDDEGNMVIGVAYLIVALCMAVAAIWWIGLYLLMILLLAPIGLLHILISEDLIQEKRNDSRQIAYESVAEFIVDGLIFKRKS